MKLNEVRPLLAKHKSPPVRGRELKRIRRVRRDLADGSPPVRGRELKHFVAREPVLEERVAPRAGA